MQLPDRWLRHSEPEEVVQDVIVGALNGGRRIDHVLQEAPGETIAETLSALRAHNSYWQSEDTALFVLTKLYGVAQ